MNPMGPEAAFDDFVRSPRIFPSGFGKLFAFEDGEE